MKSLPEASQLTRDFPLIAWRTIPMIALSAGIGWFLWPDNFDITYGTDLMRAAGSGFCFFLAAALGRQLQLGEPALRLSPEGLTGYTGFRKRVTIPWNEFHRVQTINGTILIQGKKSGSFFKRSQITLMGFTAGLSHRKVLREIETYVAGLREFVGAAPARRAAATPPPMPAPGRPERTSVSPPPMETPMPSPSVARTRPALAGAPAFGSGSSRFGKRPLAGDPAPRKSPHEIRRRV